MTINLMPDDDAATTTRPIWATPSALAPSQRLTVSLPESDSAIPHLTLHQPIWASWDAAQAHRLPAA
jgi:hypothetical protein